MKKTILIASILVVLGFIFMNFKQDLLKESKPSNANNFEQSGDSTFLKQGSLQSPDYVQGQLGWKLNSKGGFDIGGSGIDKGGGITMGKSFVINRRSGANSTLDDVFEIYPQLAATSPGNNYMFFGRKGSSSTINTYRLILAANNFIEFDVNTGSVFTVNAGDITPTTNNTISLGTSSLKWSDVRSVLINGADIGFANGWKFREWPATKEDIGKSDEWMKKNANQGIQLLDENDNLIAVFHKNGTLYTNNIKSLSELPK